MTDNIDADMADVDEHYASDEFHTLTPSSEHTPVPSDDDLLARLAITTGSNDTVSAADDALTDSARLLTRTTPPDPLAFESFSFASRPQFNDRNNVTKQAVIRPTGTAVGEPSVVVSSDKSELDRSGMCNDACSDLILTVADENIEHESESCSLPVEQLSSSMVQENSEYVQEQDHNKEGSENSTPASPQNPYALTAAYPPAVTASLKRKLPLGFTDRTSRPLLSVQRTMQQAPTLFLKSQDKSSSRPVSRAALSLSKSLTRSNSEGQAPNDKLPSAQRDPLQDRRLPTNMTGPRDDDAEVEKKQMQEALQILAHTWSKAQSTATLNNKTLTTDLAAANAEIRRLTTELNAVVQQKATITTSSELQKERDLERAVKVEKLTQNVRNLEDLIEMLRKDAAVQQQTLKQDAEEVATFKAECTDLQDVVNRRVKKSHKLNNKMVAVMQSMKAQLEASQLSAEYLLSQLEEKTGLLVESRDEVRALRAQQADSIKPVFDESLKLLAQQMASTTDRLTDVTKQLVENKGSTNIIRETLDAVSNLQQKGMAESVLASNLTGQVISKLDIIEKKDSAIEQARMLLDVRTLQQDLLQIGVAVDNTKDLQKRNTQLTAQLASLRTYSAETNEISDSLRYQLTNATQGKKLLQEQIDNVTSKLGLLTNGEGNDNEERLCILREKLRTLQESLDEAQADQENLEAENCELEETCGDLNRELGDVEKEDSRKDERLAEIRKRVTDLRDSFFPPDQAVLSAQTGIYTPAESFKHCQKDILKILNDVEQRIVHSRTEAARFASEAQSQVSLLMTDLQQSKQETSSLQEQLAHAEADLIQVTDQSQQDIGALMADLQDAMLSVALSKAATHAIEATLASQESLTAKLADEVESTRSELIEAKTTATATAAQVSAQRDIIRRNMQDLGTSLASTRQALGLADQRVVQLEDELSAAQQESRMIAELKLELAHAEEQVLHMEVLEEKLADAELDLLDDEEIRLDLAYTEEQLMLVEEDAARYKEESNKLRCQEGDNHRNELQRVEGEKKALEATNHYYAKLEHDLLKKLDEVKSAMGSLDAAHETSKATIRDLAAKNTSTEEELAILRAERLIKEADIHHLHVELQLANQCAADLAQQFDNAKTKFEILQAERDEASQEVLTLKTQLEDQGVQKPDEDANLIISRLEHELAAARAMVDGFKTEAHASVFYTDRTLPNETPARLDTEQRPQTPVQDVNDLFEYLATDIQSSAQAAPKENDNDAITRSTTQPVFASATTKRKRVTYDDVSDDDSESEAGDPSFQGGRPGRAKRTRKGDATNKLKSNKTKTTPMTDTSRGKLAKNGYDWSDMLLSSNTPLATDKRNVPTEAAPTIRPSTSGTDRAPLKAVDANIRARSRNTRSAKHA